MEPFAKGNRLPMIAMYPARALLCAFLNLSMMGAALAAPPKSPASLPPLPLPTSPAAAPAASVPTAPAPAASDVALYDGRSLADVGLSVSAWGGGSAEESTAISLAHGHALKITTLSPYEGATVTFSAPVSLDPGPNKDRTLLLTLRLTTVSRHFALPPAAPGGTPQTPDNAAPGGDNGGDNGQTNGAAFRTEPGGARFRLAQAMPPGVMPPGMMPPPNMTLPAAPPASGSSTQDFTGVSALSALRLVFTLQNGTQVDVLRPFPDLNESDAGADSEQWVTLGVPLAALHFPASAAASPLRSITIGGDDYAVFYLGQIKIASDSAPITCSAGDQQTAAAGDVVTLHGNASGGASSLQFNWDFDASDGVTAQASGQTVTTQYLTGGRDYKVTLTVSDIDGLKKPAVSTTIVHVE